MIGSTADIALFGEQFGLHSKRVVRPSRSALRPPPAGSRSSWSKSSQSSNDGSGLVERVTFVLHSITRSGIEPVGLKQAPEECVRNFIRLP